VAYVPGAKEIYGEPIIAQAEWDVDTLVKRMRCTKCPPFIATLVLTAGLGLPCACYYCNAPCEIRELRDKYRATHLLLTTHNVIQRVDEHYGKCPCPCCRIGAEEVIIRLHNISDVSTETTAGCGHCCVDWCWPITTVFIQDPGRGGPGAEIVNLGIRNGVEFKSAIIAAQRGDYKSSALVQNHPIMSGGAVGGVGQPQTGANANITAELQQLADLKARGAITDQEYNIAKARILTPAVQQPPAPVQMGGPDAFAAGYAVPQQPYYMGGYPPQQQQQQYAQQQYPPQPYQQQQQPQQYDQQQSSDTVDGGEKPRRY